MLNLITVTGNFQPLSIPIQILWGLWKGVLCILQSSDISDGWLLKPVWRVPGRILCLKNYCCFFPPYFCLFPFIPCFLLLVYHVQSVQLCLWSAFWAILRFLSDAFWNFRPIKRLTWPNSSFKDNSHPASLGCLHLCLYHSCRKQVTLLLISFSTWTWYRSCWIMLPNSVSDAACLTFLT